MLKNSLKSELKYVFFSKIFLTILLALAAVYSIVLFMNYQSTVYAFTEYSNYLQSAEERGDDVESLLNEDFSISEKSTGLFEGSGSITNPLAYYADQFKNYLYASSPAYTLTQMLEISVFIVFPLIFGILGLFLGTYDYTHKTIKMKGVRFSRWRYHLSKHLTLYTVISIAFVSALLIAAILGRVMFSFLGHAIDVESYLVDLPQSSILLKMFLAYAVGILFGEIGYTLGLTLKRTSLGIVVLFAYIGFVPALGKYDLRNGMKALASKVYEFYGMVQIEAFYEIPTFAATAILLLAFAIFVTAGAFIAKKRSLYE